MELNEFLVWLTAGGSVIAWSWIMEQVPWFQSLSVSAKKWVQLGGSVAIAIGALAVTMYVPKETLELIAPWFKLIAGLFGVIFVNQIAHAYDPNRK